MTEAPQRVLVVVPTYDERENLPGALARLRTHVPDADVLVVDDGSPDGTGELAEKIAEREPTTTAARDPRAAPRGQARPRAPPTSRASAGRSSAGTT